ncbi:MAG: hypothetical protein JKY99_09440 [Rhizobiales bacterium]|nr:hypothetical protein [Hyphomicrobiales bacterium]
MQFSACDIIAIETFAKDVIGRSPHGPDKSKIKIGTNTFPVSFKRPHSLPQSGTLGEHDLRGEFSWTNKEIQIRSFQCTLPNNEESFEHCVGVIVHELVHALQFNNLSEEQKQEAIDCAKDAKNCPECYAKYLTCEVELPAHAAMIAFSLRKKPGDDFDQLAPKTSFFQYFSEKLGKSPEKAAALSCLLSRAKNIHSTLSS